MDNVTLSDDGKQTLDNVLGTLVNLANKGVSVEITLLVNGAWLTGTVIGDSYLIEGGRPGRPLLPNRVRIHANLPTLLSGVLGVGSQPQPTVAWSEFGRTIISPEVAVTGLRCTPIGEGAWGS